MSNQNYNARDVNSALPLILTDLLRTGEETGSRNGRTKEFTHIGITLREPWRRELLVPHRKHNLAAQIAETMWILAGRNDIEFLSHYLPRAADFSDDGKVWRGGYGPRIRDWKGVDQIKYVVETLKADPNSRQAIIGIWDPKADTIENTRDRPCNDLIQFTLRKSVLEMSVYIRSNDAMWGWSGINTFEWSALHEIVAYLVGAAVGAVHFNVGSFHLYEVHWNKAGKICNSDPYPEIVDDSPRFYMDIYTLSEFDKLVNHWFDIEADIRGGYDMADAVNAFPEPMLQSWLRVIQWWWSGDDGYLIGLPRLKMSAGLSVQPKQVKKVDLIDRVIALHNDKDAAYGDSWCKRGEMLGIMANIARKVDRIESGKDTADETQLDTAMDLFVYSAKYLAWILNDNVPSRNMANEIMRAVAGNGGAPTPDGQTIQGIFAALEMAVVNHGERQPHIKDLLDLSWKLVTELSQP